MNLCDTHQHAEPRPCIGCCYTDNGYCPCSCHTATTRVQEQLGGTA